MYCSIVKLAEQCPDITLSVKAGELMEAVNYCVSKTRSDLEQIIQDEAQEKYLSIEKTAELLDVDRSSIWRWTKAGILKPVVLGGKRRFRLSDINKLLEA